MAGLQTFKRGNIWRVGTGSQINIWNDRWISESPTRKVLTRRGQALVEKVEDLIDPATHSWDEALIRSIFLPIDMERILKIPLSKHLLEDFVAWHATKPFCFSVRPAYYIEWEHQFGARLG